MNGTNNLPIPEIRIEPISLHNPNLRDGLVARLWVAMQDLVCINVKVPDKHESQDSGFCLYNQTMLKSDGDRFPAPGNWEQRVLKAASYAACALNHPLYRLQAQETRISAYGLAFLDCLGGPQLIAVDSSRWSGRIGERIHFHVRNNVRVMQVRILIRESKTSKRVFESGYAYASRLNASMWTYITQTEIRQTPGLCIGVLANDLAGNLGVDIVEFDYE